VQALDAAQPRLGRPRIELQRGWVHALDVTPWRFRGAPLDGAERLGWLLDDALRREVTVSVELDAAQEKRGACSPFHPGRALRAHVERRALAGELPPVRAVLYGHAFQLTQLPHPSCVLEDERGVIALLSHARTLPEIASARLCPPQAVDRLLGFLWDVGGLAIEAEDEVGERSEGPTEGSSGNTAGDPSPLELLGLGPHATLKDVRAAYRRLARELHPDLHPGAVGDERAQLEARFRAVHEAYRRLVG
jgi:hypothetical protein